MDEIPSPALPRPVRRGPRLTGRGWGMVVVAGVLVGAGVLWREVALVHMGCFLGGVVGAAWWLARGNLRGVGIERLAPTSAFVGEWIPVTVRLTGPSGGFGAWSVELADELLGELGQGVGVRVLRPGEVREFSGQTRLRKRGRGAVFRWELASTFPGGVWRVREHGWHAVAITVFPRAVTPAEMDDPRAVLDDEEGSLWQPKPDWGGDFLGIRDFQPGDPIKQVHWPASARAQKLVVREYDQRLPTSHALFFHSFQVEGRRRLPDAFEASLELLTGLLLRCTEASVPVSVSADFLQWRAIRLTAGGGLRETLAHFAAARSTPGADLGPLIEQLEAVPAESHVYVVSDTPLRYWQPQLVIPGQLTVTCLSVGEWRRRHVFRTGRTSLIPS